MTPGEELFRSSLRRDDWDMLEPATREAWEQRARGEDLFIPSRRSSALNIEPEHAAEIPVALDGGRRDITLEAVHGITLGELPGGARQIWKLAAKADFVLKASRTVTYERGIVVAIGGEATLHRRPQRFAATWQSKPWTKAGADGTFAYVGAHIWPAYRGGGLHDSKALRAFLKGEE